MTSFSPSKLGRGFNMAEWGCSLVNRTAAQLSVGDVVAIDLLGASTEALAANLGDGTDADPLANAVDVLDGQAAQTAGTSMAIVAVAAEVIADNDAGNFWLRHPCVECNVDGATVTGSLLLIGTDNTAANNRQLDLIATAETNLGTGQVTKFVALALEADTSNLALCVFDGVQGFGVYSATT